MDAPYRFMSTGELTLEAQYPALFTSQVWFGNTDVKFSRLDTPPQPDNLIANINIIPKVGNKWLILQTEDGDWEIPGGTREPDEPIINTLKRELLEEAGAELISDKIIPIGAWHCHNHGEPYRPHTPHPIYYRYVVTASVKIIDKPSNPDDGEQIVKVEAVDLETIIDRFKEANRADIADLFKIANSLWQ